MNATPLLHLRLRAHRPETAATRVLPAPVVVGNDPRCDVVVASPASALAQGNDAVPFAWIVGWANGRATVRDLATGAPLDASALRAVGILEVKPHDGRLPWWKDRRVVGLHAGGLAAALVAFFGAGMVTLASARDASDVPQPLALDERVGRVFLADEGEARFPRGVTFALDVPADVERIRTRLAFRVRGVAGPGAFAVTVDGRPVLEPKLPEACLARPCTLDVPLPAGALRAGRALVRFENRAGGEDFALAGVRVGRFPPATPAELARVEELVGSAAEFFANRGVAKVNIIRARLNIENAAEIIERAEVPEALAASARSLRADVRGALAETAERTFLDVETALRLGDDAAAGADVAELRKVFPDDTTPQGKKLQAFEDLIKRRAQR